MLQTFNYDSQSEHVAQAVGLSRRGEIPYGKDTLHDSDRIEFWGRDFADLEDLENSATSAWPEGIETLESMVADLKDEMLSPPQSVRRRPTYRDDDGDEICHDRLAVGKPFWRTTVKQRQVSQRTVTIAIGIATPASMDSRDIFWRGAAAVCLTHLLEQAGYRVELLCVEASVRVYENGDNYLSVTRYKSPSDPLDLASLATGFAGWYYRTVCLWSKCRCDSAVVKRNFGHATEIGPLMPQITTDQEPITCENLWDRESAVAWVRKKLAAFN